MRVVEDGRAKSVAAALRASSSSTVWHLWHWLPHNARAPGAKPNSLLCWTSAQRLLSAAQIPLHSAPHALPRACACSRPRRPLSLARRGWTAAMRVADEEERSRRKQVCTSLHRSGTMRSGSAVDKRNVPGRWRALIGGASRDSRCFPSADHARLLGERACPFLAQVAPSQNNSLRHLFSDSFISFTIYAPYEVVGYHAVVLASRSASQQLAAGIAIGRRRRRIR